MGKIKYTNQDIEFIRKEYPSNGAEWVAQRLNKSIEAIRSKAKRLKIKYCGNFNYTFDFILDLNNDTFIYLLGYFWADGYLNAAKTRKCFTFSINKSDALNIQQYFTFCPFRVSEYKLVFPRCQLSFHTANKGFCDFLYENDFATKSHVEPTKLLSVIPRDKHYLFWRGFLDGDGTIAPERTHKRISFSGSYEYKWSELSKFFQENNIDYYIKRRFKKPSSGSAISVIKYNDIIRLGNIIYPKLKLNKIGLFRKYKNLISIIKLAIKTLDFKHLPAKKCYEIVSSNNWTARPRKLLS